MTKFNDPFLTAKNEQRAFVDLQSLQTLWFNTGTRCNLSCENCYIESTPHNDRLSYLTAQDISSFLDEGTEMGTKQIGLTGGEPFLNPSIIPIITLSLKKGFKVLVLTNAYKVIKRHLDALSDLNQEFGSHLQIRISLDHYTKDLHEKERGAKTFDETLEMIHQLFHQGFNITLAGRSLKDEEHEQALAGYVKLLKDLGIDFKDKVNEKLVIFPEMDLRKDVPEITTACWGILDKKPEDQMCASERMIVKRKGEEKPVVLPCTLLAYDEQFNLGDTLTSSKKRVQLNHKFCAQFCVLGGASCSSTS